MAERGIDAEWTIRETVELGAGTQSGTPEEAALESILSSRTEIPVLPGGETGLEIQPTEHLSRIAQAGLLLHSDLADRGVRFSSYVRSV